MEIAAQRAATLRRMDKAMQPFRRPEEVAAPFAAFSVDREAEEGGTACGASNNAANLARALARSGGSSPGLDVSCVAGWRVRAA
eukprot:1872860-Pleurochrysis_carterae.AAC.1